MTDAILVLNAGSSSLKFSVFSDDARAANGATLAATELGASSRPGHQGAADFLLDWLEQRLGAQHLAAAGHRVVHGGLAFSAPVRVDAAVLDALERLVPLAPLHQPHNLAAVDSSLILFV